MVAAREVPSPIDLRRVADARDWASTAMMKRPWRSEFFESFAAAIHAAPLSIHRLLELGSGPGFLAAHLLKRLPSIEYVALDFSEPMHELAAERLGPLASRVKFVERNFKEPSWVDGLGIFDCVVTQQAVHELRHRSYAVTLHREVRTVLAPGGIYLVCDHFLGEGGMSNGELYMSAEEQRDCLLAAGFTEVVPLLQKGGLVLHHAT
jgi:SAM-dependent methyltransferase